MKQDAPLKVLMLTSSYPRFESDNSSIFLRYLAKNIANNGESVHVLAPDHPSVQETNIDDNIHNHWFKYLPRKWQTLTYGSGILPNLKENKLLFFQVPFFLMSMFFALFFLCKKIKPDVIHAHWVVPQGSIAILVGKILKIPVITTAHGSDAFALNNGVISQLKKYTVKHSKYWTSNTKATANCFDTSDDALQPIIIPMGVDIQRFEKAATEVSNKIETRNIILFAGRLIASKGVKDLILAFSKLPDHLLNHTDLWIIGDGIERNNLEQLTAHLNFTNVEFWGEIPNHQLPNFYVQATIFVAPSLTEGQGIILLEAMSSGTPIIATDVGGIPEVISHQENGLIVPPSNPSELTIAIQSLLQDKPLANMYADNALVKVKQQYSWESVARKFIATYRQTLT